MSVLLDRIERMFEGMEQWQSRARQAMAKYADHRRLIDQLEAESAVLLAEAVKAYAWPEEIEVPSRSNCYSVESLNAERFGEDMSAELAVASTLFSPDTLDMDESAGRPRRNLRKVRTPQSTVVGNTHLGRPTDKCHRK